MTINSLAFREIAVFLSAIVYWGGVVINVYRIRKHTGKSPNLMKSRSLKERLLSLGWLIIIAGWMGQPFLIEKYSNMSLFSFMDPLFIPFGVITGLLLALIGYAGTLWCYKTLGDSWRLGVNSKVKTVLVKDGIYRYVRHPIYMFQIIILIGVAWLLPTLLSFLILLIHFICISVMTRDEEEYLMKTHGAEYESYYSVTGRFFLKWKPRN